MRFWSLTGLTPYESARQLQLKLLVLRAADQIDDTVLFLEHEPVVTRGRGLQTPTGGHLTRNPDDDPLDRRNRLRHMPLASPLPASIPLVESERGGDLTYHGPGQLVIYPIVKLDGTGFGPDHDIEGFLRRLERTFIDVLSQLSKDTIQGRSEKDATGVWVGDKKVASIGIAIRKWVVYHGMSINCVNDLAPFKLISPCGFSPEVMTNIKELLPSFDREDWREKLEELLATHMNWRESRPGLGPLVLRMSCEKAFAQAMSEDPGVIIAGNSGTKKA